jgi:glycosyltransferase involved in cell wall biosynthesis
MPKISVVMASYLGEYPNCASHRRMKFERAIRSYVQQTHADKELVVVSDGCNDTIELYDRLRRDYDKHPAIRNWKLVVFSKKEPFSGLIRNAGMDCCTGDIICYLDTDDFFWDHHLESINNQFRPEVDWVYYNDFVPDMDTSGNLDRTFKTIRQRDNILAEGRIGTSSIAHRNPKYNSNINALWTSGYGHDWRFVQCLMNNEHHIKIQTPGYMVCHIPGQFDF